MLAPGFGFGITAASASLAISFFPLSRAGDKLNLYSLSRVAKARRELSISSIPEAETRHLGNPTRKQKERQRIPSQPSPQIRISENRTSQSITESRFFIHVNSNQ
jgi:hypothetical protein